MSNAHFCLYVAWEGAVILKSSEAVSLCCKALQDMCCIAAVCVSSSVWSAHAFAVKLPNVPTYSKGVWLVLWSGLKALDFFKVNLNRLQECI